MVAGQFSKNKTADRRGSSGARVEAILLRAVSRPNEGLGQSDCDYADDDDEANISSSIVPLCLSRR